jgi:hypothetical protein
MESRGGPGLDFRPDQSFAVARNDLLWLTSRDALRLGARQREIARNVAEMAQMFLKGSAGGSSDLLNSPRDFSRARENGMIPAVLACGAGGS